MAVGLALFCLSCTSEPASLQRYTCLSDHLSLNSYENGRDSTISFNPQGVILSKGQHHPVLTAIYGILCYDHFMETGDSAYYQKVTRQARYFLNSDTYETTFDGKGLRLPYHFNFHDLIAPWYSGMAQGMAVSLLLRYQKLTGDKEVNGICKKLIYYMLQPDYLGGTIGRMKNGQPWIEEYPRSKKVPHVLNGSINAWIGLHEYCQAFPGDKSARSWRDSLLRAFEDNLDAYSMNWWCHYDLGTRDCSPSYMRYHVYQMQHLHEITGNPRFKLQEALWACFLHGKPIEPIERFSNKKYNLAIKAVYKPHGWCVPDYRIIPSVGRQGAAAVSYNFASTDELQKFLRNKGIQGPPAEEDPSQKVILMQFDGPINADFMSITSASMAESVSIDLFAVTDSDELVPIPVVGDRPDPTFWQAKLTGPIPEAGYNRLVVVFSGANASKVEKTETGLWYVGPRKLPRYGFYRSTALSFQEGERYQINVPRREVDEVMIFYRNSAHMEDIGQAIFSPDKMVEGDVLEVNETGYYQFLVVYKVKSLLSLVRMLLYEKVE